MLTDAQLARFWSYVDKTDDCWNWTRPNTKTGYGQFWQGPGLPRRVAHRVAYEHLVGEVPDGLVLDHLCRNRACVNPDHLEPVTNRENQLRGETVIARNNAKALCDYGHPFSDDNTVMVGSERRCLTCRRRRDLENYYRNRDAINAKRRARRALKREMNPSL